MYKSICVEVYVYIYQMSMYIYFFSPNTTPTILPYRPKRPSQPLREVPEADRRDWWQSWRNPTETNPMPFGWKPLAFISHVSTELLATAKTPIYKASKFGFWNAGDCFLETNVAQTLTELVGITKIFTIKMSYCRKTQKEVPTISGQILSFNIKKSFKIAMVFRIQTFRKWFSLHGLSLFGCSGFGIRFQTRYTFRIHHSSFYTVIGDQANFVLSAPHSNPLRSTRDGSIPTWLTPWNKHNLLSSDNTRWVRSFPFG